MDCRVHGVTKSRTQLSEFHYLILRASLVAQLVGTLPAMQETWVRSLGWEDPLEKGKATHSSILAWRSPWIYLSFGASLIAQLVKNPPAMQDTLVQFLGQEDLLEKG